MLNSQKKKIHVKAILLIITDIHQLLYSEYLLHQLDHAGIQGVCRKEVKYGLSHI